MGIGEFNSEGYPATDAPASYPERCRNTPSPCHWSFYEKNSECCATHDNILQSWITVATITSDNVRKSVVIDKLRLQASHLILRFNGIYETHQIKNKLDKMIDSK